MAAGGVHRHSGVSSPSPRTRPPGQSGSGSAPCAHEPSACTADDANPVAASTPRPSRNGRPHSDDGSTAAASSAASHGSERSLGTHADGTASRAPSAALVTRCPGTYGPRLRTFGGYRRRDENGGRPKEASKEELGLVISLTWGRLKDRRLS
jgi:hypothetical protein